MPEADAPEWPRNEPRKKPGRKEWEPTKVERLKAAIAFGSGATQESVGHMLGVAKSTVQKHLDREFRFGREISDMVLRQRLWRKAIKEGDTAALIFLAKNQLGMKDRVESSGDPNNPPPPNAPELCLRVTYVPVPADPRACLPPPPEMLIDARAKRVED